jgi:DNA topoisomerase-2
MDDSYDYITSIPLFNLTEEKVNELLEQFNNKQQELVKVQSTTEIDQWNSELDEFVEAYNKWTKVHSNLDNKQTVKSTSVKSNGVKVTTRPSTASSVGSVAKAKTSTASKPKAKPKSAK